MAKKKRGTTYSRLVKVEEFVNTLFDLYREMETESWSAFFQVAVYSLFMGFIVGGFFGALCSFVLYIISAILASAGVIVIPYGEEHFFHTVLPPLAIIGWVVGSVWLFTETYFSIYDNIERKIAEKLTKSICELLLELEEGENDG